MKEESKSTTGTGDGLVGGYFDNRDLYGAPVIERVDKQVDFEFGGPANDRIAKEPDLGNRIESGLPAPKGNEFSVRWLGELQAQFSEPYTISVTSDDGARMWLNEQLIIDDWNCHPPRESSATVNLVSGQRYLLRIEYFQAHGRGGIKLEWSSPSTPRQTVPQSQLYSQPTLDDGGNGLPVLWQELYLGRTGANPDADPDRDGLSNLEEWERHTNPNDPMDPALPAPWGHGDIDQDGGSKGNAAHWNGVFTVSSSGMDIYKKQDSFHYVYRPLGRKGQLIARVAGIEGTNDYPKAGVMVRETLDNDARNAFMLMRGIHGVSFQWRAGKGWGTAQTVCTNVAAPHWLKVVRNGDWLGGYYSADGASWTLLNWQTMEGLAPTVFVGLAVTPRNLKYPGGSVTAQFDHVETGPADETALMNPVVGDGDGLLGSYCGSSLLYLPGVTNRVDQQVNFAWVHEPPVSGVSPDSYGVCWSGEVQAQFTEPYTFSVVCRQENWVRLWINEQLVLNQWRVGHTNGDFKGAPVDLVAGRHYLIRVEMYNHQGKGKAVLNWSSPSTSERLVLRSQLYSTPADKDGNGLPDLWEEIYFGHGQSNPQADPDGDGLSNREEYQYHTNPLKADTEADGMPDSWELARGLDPQFDDAGLDYDNSGLSNLQKYHAGLDPFDTDINRDGLPDSFEVRYLGTGPTLVCTGEVRVVRAVNGSSATNFLGGWRVEGTDICALERRGGLDFVLPTAAADKYVLNLVGTQNEPNPWETRFKLLLTIDGQGLGSYVLNAGFGTNGTVELVLPYLRAGGHTLRVFWDGAAGHSSLRIKQLKLLSVSGADADHNGIKDWVERMVATESGLDNTNQVIGSYTSPACLEGRDPYRSMMTLRAGREGGFHLADIPPRQSTGPRWYADVPLLAQANTVLHLAHQNGGRSEERTLQWLPVNVLDPGVLDIRAGDSLLLGAWPSAAGPVHISVSRDGRVLARYTVNAYEAVPHQFDTAGTYRIRVEPPYHKLSLRSRGCKTADPASDSRQFTSAATSGLIIPTCSSRIVEALHKLSLRSRRCKTADWASHSRQFTSAATSGFKIPTSKPRSGNSRPGRTSPGGGLVVRVIDFRFPAQPVCMMNRLREWQLTNVPSPIELRADPRLKLSQTGVLPDQGRLLSLFSDQNELRTLIARAGETGGILDDIQVPGVRLFATPDTGYNQVIAEYPDGSRLVETLEVLSPVLANVTVRMWIIVGGVTFDDGTTLRELTAADFDPLGQCKVRFIMPEGAETANCHAIKLLQGAAELGTY